MTSPSPPPTTPPTPGPKQEPVRMDGSRLFVKWLHAQNASLVFTTYQAGKIYFIGLQETGTFSVFERSFDRCMGVCVHENSLWMAARHQLWRFTNTLEAGQRHKGYDAHYVPLVGHTTGDVDVHDIGVLSNGRPIFVVTLFNCLATLQEDYSFMPVWKPPFISRLVAEDRCHLNGLAMEKGRPRYVTMVSRSDVVEGWRQHRRDGGVVMDVATNEVVCEGLSMPHSPRLHNGRLWLLNAGTGELGWVDLVRGRFEPIAFCPGFLRGLAFSGDYAIVGLSKTRKNRSFSDLVLGERMEQQGLETRCGLQVIHLETGAASHSLNIEGVIEELYDVAVIPNVRRPMALGFRTEEILFHIRLAPPSSLVLG